ncbi:hypothetical protein CROQUDRAFT_43068 [Cronartium quercuum f. sp. fusiforme G11]|uniref:Uncharacterized protein n=1 Tax=Cronartium quercuum f. sp. fusiforme G11 TaxID=708437 RepID=A0A9P6NJU5_9BASI|nr:hypothetical protein CROQUDRAFT_43068 [Cronartium quercuum f. sp. fusiforme G11]
MWRSIIVGAQLPDALVDVTIRTDLHQPHVSTELVIYRKIPSRLSSTRKANVRKRLREVDSVIQAVKESGVQCRALQKALELPTEAEMDPKDKYFVFSARSKGYRKGIHKVPHFTKVTHRVNPKGF